MTDALRGSQSFGMKCPAGGAKLKHTFCAALPAPQMSPGKRSSIHEYLSFRAAVETDAGTAAAAHIDESKGAVCP